MTTIRTLRAATTIDTQATGNLADAVTQSASSGLLVQTYCTQVLNQPGIVIPASVASKLPPIGKYLQTAQDNANSYLTSLQPRMITVVTDVGGYASQFTSFVALINGKINDWKGGSTSAKQDALALLQQLQLAVGTKREGVVAIATDLTSLKVKFDADTGNFNSAASQADIVIGGDQGALKSLQDSVDSLNKQIGGAAAGVALSALAVIGGAFLVCVGAIADFVTAGASTPVVIGGAALVAVGIGGLTASSIVLSKLIDSKSNLLQQEAQLNANLKFLHDFKGTVGQLASSASVASQQLTNMSNAWTILGGNLNNVVGSVQSARTFSDLPIVVQAYLSTASSQWTSVLGNVQTIESQLSGVKTSIVGGDKALGQLNSASIAKIASAA